jgi:hypothetical protein
MMPYNVYITNWQLHIIMPLADVVDMYVGHFKSKNRLHILPAQVID